MPTSVNWSLSFNLICVFLPPMHATCLTHLILLVLIIRIFGEEYKS